MKDDYEALTEERDGLINKISQLENQIANLEESNSSLMQQYDKLHSSNEELLNDAMQEKIILEGELGDKEKTLNEKEKSLSEMEIKLQTRERSLEQLTKSIQEKEAIIGELTHQLEQQKRLTADLKRKIRNALTGFQSSDLSIEERDGKIYVTMSQNLLFAKGSDQIDQKGLQAIQSLANVLKDNTDFYVTVEGHTDIDGTAEKNWDLSVMRATAVTKLLTRYGVDPTKLIASGRAFYYPVAPNDIESNKTKNRRTEIIISPDLKTVMDFINDF
jgi:chemotaxis protein MotB